MNISNCELRNVAFTLCLMLSLDKQLLCPAEQLQSWLARIIHESVSRDRKDVRATWQPKGLESEAYLNSTS